MEESPVIRTPDQRLRVFVSSTLEECAEERAAVRDAIGDLHLTPVMFELGASPHPPRALYRAYLEQSHVFVGVYWERYGWVAPDMEVSGLEDEYLLSDGMPRLIYFKEPAGEREDPMTEFVKRIKSGDNSFRKFSSTHELAELLREDLAHLLTERFESIPRVDGESISPAELDRRSALPVPVTRLFGRDEDTAKLLELVSSDDVRLVTLTGVGGIGKSRLAMEVAAKVQAAGMRVPFVDLTPVTDSDEAPRAIAAALSVSDDGARPLIESLVERLRASGPTLLVLDNFEQIVGAGRYVSDLLAGCPDLKVMVASRILLDIRGEHHWEVAPLAYPATGDGRDLEVMAECPAVELFIDRAQSADPRFVFGAEEVDAVSELCGRLEGIPLALELTAAYVRFLPPASMLERFDQRLDLEAHADHPDRQRTLRATIEWSYGLLDEAERELFGRLSVFSGGWNLRAALAICGKDCRADVLQTLSHLVDKSLVTIDDGRGSEPRFRMLETVRTFAVEKLEASGETAEMRLRHAEYFASLCEEVGPKLSEDQTWIPTLDPDRENLLVIHERVPEDERLAEPLVRAWAAVWVYAWARDLARRVVEILEAMEGAAGTINELPVDIRAKFAFLMGAGRFLTGDPEGARSWSRQVLELTDETGDKRLRALALVMLGGSIPYETGRDEADSALTESVELSREAGFLLGLDLALAQLGILRMREGRLDEAVAIHTECLGICRQLNAETLTAYALGELSLDHLFKGDLETSREYLVELAECCRTLERQGHRENSAYCLEGLAALARAQGKAELAARLGGASLAVREVISTPVWALFADLFETLTASLRQELGPEVNDALVAEGAAMTALDAISLGIAETAGPSA
jgi:predicted ATPase